MENPPPELDRFTRPNEQELEIARCFCLARDGYKCNRSKKTVQELIIEDRIRRQLQNKSERKLPILVLNHLDGTMNFHSKDHNNGNLILYGNVELISWSENAKFKPAEVDFDPNEVRTYASRKSHNAYVKMINMTNNYLVKFEHGCEERLVNKYSKVIKCSQDILRKYLKREYETRYDLFDINELNITCDYKFCSGIHVCFWNTRPKPTQTDLDKFQEEVE